MRLMQPLLKGSLVITWLPMDNETSLQPYHDESCIRNLLVKLENKAANSFLMLWTFLFLGHESAQTTTLQKFYLCE